MENDQSKKASAPPSGVEMKGFLPIMALILTIAFGVAMFLTSGDAKIVVAFLFGK